MPDERPMRIIRNTSSEELNKMWNSEILTIPPKSEIEVIQGLAFFLKAKFPDKIEILPVEEQKEKKIPPRSVMRVLKVEEPVKPEETPTKEEIKKPKK